MCRLASPTIPMLSVMTQSMSLHLPTQLVIPFSLPQDTWTRSIWHLCTKRPSKSTSLTMSTSRCGSNLHPSLMRLAFSLAWSSLSASNLPQAVNLAPTSTSSTTTLTAASSAVVSARLVSLRLLTLTSAYNGTKNVLASVQRMLSALVCPSLSLSSVPA